jgi:hypothetical protein
MRLPDFCLRDYARQTATERPGFEAIAPSSIIKGSDQFFSAMARSNQKPIELPRALVVEDGSSTKDR